MRRPVLSIAAFIAPVLFACPAYAGTAVPGKYCVPVSKDVRAERIAFTLPQLGGGTLQVSNVANKPLMISFFASWCVPCNMEMPDVLRLSQAYQDKGLRVVLVDVGEKQDRAKAFEDKFHITLPIVIDEKSQVFDKVYGSYGIPTSVFYNAKGVLTCIAVQGLEWYQLDNEASAAVGGWMP